MIKNRERFQRAFALPTVLITSTVMMIVLLVVLTSVSSIGVSLDGQYYNKLAREAGESGLTMAKACMSELGANTTWSNSTPLRPNTGCDGGAACTNSAQCFVLSDANTKSTFAVEAPVSTGGVTSITVRATVQLLRTSNGEVWKTYTDTVTDKIAIGWKQISMSYYFSCGVTREDQAYCWGRNDGYQLGNGTTVAVKLPAAVDNGAAPMMATYKSVAAGYDFACGIGLIDEKAYCWGTNTNGQLGNGTTTTAPTPVQVSLGAMPTNAKLKDITAGYNFACATTTSGKMYCWGGNANGQLGNGTTVASTTPVAVTTSSNFKSISAGYAHVCGITLLDKVHCWGQNAYGQLGRGNTTASTTPIPVAAGAISAERTMKNIATGYYHTCATDTSNQMYCWGQNTYGQLGNNSTATATSPVAVSNGAIPVDAQIDSLTGGATHTCAIATSKAYCWGRNNNGQLGNGTTTDSSIPVAVDSAGVLNGIQLTGIVADDSLGSCALSVGAKAYCWGYNVYGHLGNGTSTSPLVNPTGTRSVTTPGVVF